MKSLRISVKPGTIQVNHVQVMQATKDIILLEVDCRTKHSSIVPGYSSGKTWYEFELEVNEETLYSDTSKTNNTAIRVSGLDSNWIMLSSFGSGNFRYGFHICFVRPVKPSKATLDLSWYDKNV